MHANAVPNRTKREREKNQEETLVWPRHTCPTPVVELAVSRPVHVCLRDLKTKDRRARKPVGTDFSVVKWYKALVQRHHRRRRDPEEPFYLNKDMVRAYTYRCALTDLRFFAARAGWDASGFGLHGARVLGYNLSKRFNGVPVGADAAAAGGDDAAESGDDADVAGGDDDAGDDEDDADGVLLPPGYVARRASGVRVFRAPDGTEYGSRAACWLHEDRQRPLSRLSSVLLESPVRGSPSPRARARGRARVQPMPTPVAGSAAAAATLGEVVPEFERPSTRRPPASRTVV